MSGPLAGARVLVTGGNGFIGTNLMAALAREGAVARCVDSRPPRDASSAPAWKRVDILDREGLSATCAEFAPDYVVHLAAQTDMLAPRGDGYYRANVDGVASTIAALEGCPNVRLAVFASSKFVFANGHRPADDWDYCPTNDYGRSKVEGEKLLRSRPPSCPWVIVRPTSIWGPWFDVPYRGFFQAVARRRYLHPRGRRIHRSNGYVGNVVQQLLALLGAQPERVHGRPFFLADEPLEVLSWAQSIARATGAPPPREAPLWLLRTIAAGGDVAKALGMRNPPLTGERLRNLLTESVFDCSATAALVREPALTLDAGVAETVAWMRRQELLAGGRG